MSGVIFPKPAPGRASTGRSYWARLKSAVYDNRYFVLIVIVPTILAALYYGLIASRQYETNVDFVVRRAESNASGANVGQLLGFSLGNSASSSDAYLVQEFLLSHDAVARLAKNDDLVGSFQRPEIDLTSRLWSLSPESLLKFYRHHVAITQDDTSGISHMTVRTFRPQDSYRLASALLQMGEEQINKINERTYNDQVASSQRELNETTHQLADVQQSLTAYRKSHADIDPTDSGKAQVTLVAGLTSNLVAQRARMEAVTQALSPASPQYQSVIRQTRALDAQIAAQTAKIAGPDHSVASRLSDYEELVIKREQVAKVYAIAAAQYENAKAEAKRKQLYLIRIDEPNMPVKSEYPNRLYAVLTILAALFAAYAIGWLLWAGVKEHSL